MAPQCVLGSVSGVPVPLERGRRFRGCQSEDSPCTQVPKAGYIANHEMVQEREGLEQG